MGQQLATSLSNGGSMNSTQPVANSITGSPFTIGASAVRIPNSGEITSNGIFVSVVGESLHIHFNDEGDETNADSNDMLFPVGVYHFPLTGNQHLSAIQSSSGGTLYVEEVRETP